MKITLATYLTLLTIELTSSVKISNFETHTDMNIIHLSYI